MIDTGLDQPMKLTQEQMKLFDDVDMVVGRAITIGDPLLAMEYGKSLIRDIQVKGVALAKLLYRMREAWNLFEVSGTDGTLEEVAEFHLGRSGDTIRKYIRMWESVFENENIPADTKTRLIGRPVGDLLLLTAVAREGYDLSEMADAPDRHSLRELIKEARGEATSAGTAISIYLVIEDNRAMPTGTLYAMYQGMKYELGILEVDSDQEVVKKAIARIVNASRIQEK